MAVITENGVNIDTLGEAVLNNTSVYSVITGDVDVAPSSAAGELIAITSEADVRNQQNIADAFVQNTIHGATNLNLDNIAAIKNQKRRVNQSTIAYIKFTGVDNTIIPEGTILVSSVNNEQFLTEFSVTIESGVAYSSAASVNLSVQAIAETLSLLTPIVGVTDSVNQSDAVIGFINEPDSTLRTRLQFVGSPFTNNLKEGLFLALTELQNVSKVNILDNNTDLTIDDVPARFFSAVALGGNHAEIAKVIFRHTGVGNPTFGEIQQKVTSDITGDTYPINFNIPSELLTTVTVTLSTNSYFDLESGTEIVKNNIVDYFKILSIGEDLLLQKVEGICLIDGVVSAAVLFNGSGVNLSSTYKELFITNLSSVSVS